MKTVNNFKKVRSYINATFICVALTTIALDSTAQNSSVSFEIGRDISGNGLGGNICPAIGFTFNKFTVTAGPNFQKRKMNFSGIQTNYRYSVVKNYNQKFELFFSGNISFQSAAQLSLGNIEIEKSSHPEGTTNYENLRYKVVEGYAGIGLKINPTKNLSTTFSSGLGVFDTLDKNYNREMYREKSALVLQVRVALIYNIKLNNKF